MTRPGRVVLALGGLGWLSFLGFRGCRVWGLGLFRFRVERVICASTVQLLMPQLRWVLFS